jgi:hypothetical protein
MALFTDGPVAGMEDLMAQDTQLTNVANVEGIDVTQKRASSARLDKLKHILRNKSAEMSLGAADTSVRATSKSQ